VADVWLVVVGLATLVVGLSSLAFRWSERESAQPVMEPDGALPTGAAEVLSVLRSAVVVLDVADRVVKATPAAYAFGLVRQAALVHPQLLDVVHRVRRDGLIDDDEMELPRGPVGSATLLLEVRVAPLGPLHVLVLVQDRTEARRVEEVRRDFVANVSHELKTPVGAIALLAEAMISAADDPEAVVRFASRTQTEASRLTLLVQEIIDLTRLQTSHGLTEPRLVSVDAVIAESIDRCRLAAETKKISIERGGAQGTSVFGDHSLLVTAVRNLIDNAITYSEADTRIGIGVRGAGSLVEIAVADQGIGIAAGERERVFERFYRVDQARSRATGGTGLGLSMVKHIADNHGGDVVVWSEPGAGSTFTLRLPTASSEPSTRPSRPAVLRAVRPKRITA
jgi:two-component system sensor histidine kinase SenX3